MHERALVSQLADDLLSHLEPGERVSQVALGVNPETDPDVVELAWRSAAADSPVAAVDLLCLTRDHWLRCLACGQHYEGGKLTACPGCGANGLIVHPAPEVTLIGWVAEERV
jgi:Zn finger protein HypA/HybF involved in hydrogenase expression